MQNGTGEAQAAAVFKLVEEWNLTNRLQCMSFDTTASNTGLVSGACVLLENKLKRKLLSLACRHHIHELIVGKVFSVIMETSSGPNIKLFERFSKAWSSIDRESSESAMTDVSVAALLEPWREDMIRFCLDQLLEVQPRDDYKELLHLALLFLGAPEDHPRNILAPGAFHRARWMAKLIYCLKIYLFRSQFHDFHLTPRKLAGLRDFNIFVVQIYLKAWYRCQCPVFAPLNDLELLKQFAAYETNQNVAKTAMKSFTNHLWYLSETLIGFAFFDSRVSDEVRVTMVKAIDRSSSEDPQRRNKIDEKHISGMQLYDFVTHNTKKLFEALQIPMDFLLLHPSTWEEDEGFLAGKRKLQQLKVVNDSAKRGVALIQSFNAVLTNQEDQKQYLLQLVEKHQKDYPDSNKATIVRGQVEWL